MRDVLEHQETSGVRKSISRDEFRYAVVIERAGQNYSVYVPDLPGCVATAGSIADAEQRIREAVDFHVEGMREDGTPIPQPVAIAEYVIAQA